MKFSFSFLFFPRNQRVIALTERKLGGGGAIIDTPKYRPFI